MMPLSGLNRVVRTLCLLLLPLLLLSAPVAAKMVSLPQADGTILELDSTAKRVITLAPNLAEMMFEAGAGPVLLATVEYSDFPEQAAQLPRIGDAFRFDLEQIMALQPDLVIAWNSGNPAAALDRLESLGLKVWRTELRQPADIADLLENIGRATGMIDTSRIAAEAVRQKLYSFEERFAGKSAVSYFYQVAERPLFTLNGAHIVSQGLALCGGVNVFAAEPAIAPQITRESVLVADPDVLFAPRLPDAGDPLEHWRSWPRLKAVRNDALHHLSADRISRATPRMLDSLEIACNLLDQNRSRNSNSREKNK